MSIGAMCAKPGCFGVVVNGECSHGPHRVRERYGRASAQERGYTSRWARASRRYRQLNPMCVSCAASGKIEASEVVDHIVPHRNDQRLFWDQSNWQALCKPCHDRKTVLEDGGFGRERVTRGGLNL